MKKALRWIGIVVGSLVGLVLVGAAVLYFIGNARLNKTYDFPPSNIVIPTDAASIEYGKHWAESLCQGCHGEDLSGMEKWFDGGPLGTVDSANLTSGVGGVGQEFHRMKIMFAPSVTALTRKENRFLCSRLFPRLI
jgi:hypothetical protein